MAEPKPTDLHLPPKKRLLSLDVLRGATIAAMILVNDPGDWAHIYPPLEHSKWNGCTPTDLIFPFFLFMVGVSIVYAMETKKQDVANHSRMILRAFRRMVTLIVISWLIQLFYHPSIAHLRIPGVLQRIAVVYFIVTVLYIKTSTKAMDWIFAIALIGYWLAMTLIPVPGVGYANLNPETNLGAWVDRSVWGVDHLWRESHTWDPEGLLGTIPALGTGLFGIRVATWLKRKDRDDSVKVSWMFVYGVSAVVLALIWDLFFPINKALWTSSFVLYTGGLATIALALCFWLIDVQGREKGTWIFVVFGMNAISAYILADIVPGLIDFWKVNFNGHELKGTQYLYQAFIAPHFAPINASLVRAILFVILIWLLMYVFYKKKIIIKV
jgi:predicted acyltransferase